MGDLCAILLLVVFVKSIKEKVKTETVVNKSRFINYLFPVDSVESALKQLDIIKISHKDATHHCFAYVIGKNGETQKYDDDGEPSRTAGLPMLDVLLKNQLTNVLSVTVRYFGGIKLGAGGLVRSYANSVSNSIKESTFAYLQNLLTISISVPFSEIGHVEHLLRKNYQLKDTKYSNNVTYFVVINENDFPFFIEFFTDKTKGLCIINVIEKIEKYG